MLVSNACVNDTRVIRAAETVAELGFDTVVLAVSDNAETSEEWRNGVLYRRLAKPWLQPLAADAGRPYPRVRGFWTDSAKILRDRLRHSDNPLAQPILRGLKSIKSQFDNIINLGRPYRRALSPAARPIGLSTGFFRSLLSLEPQSILPRPLFETRRMRRMFSGDLLRLEPDIIHAHDLVMLPTGARAAKSLGALLIYDAHELEVHRNTRNGNIDKWLRYYIERKHIKECDAVVTVCNSIADYLAREYRIERPLVVMNAPDVDQQIPCDVDLRSSLGLPGDAPLTVYVGRITIGRGIEKTVDALQHLPGYHLALVGPVNKPTVEVAQRLAATLDVADRLHVVAPVAPNKVVSFISSGDVSLVPIQNVCLSYYYCLPNKLLESAMAGLPMVVSDLPELRRFVETSGTGIVMNETDPTDIARAIQEAYENKDRLQLDSARLFHTEEVYGWKKQKEALKALYASFSPLPGRSSTPRSKSREKA